MQPQNQSVADDYRIVQRGQHLKLKRRPSRMRVVATLEIPLHDEDGTYLVVMHPDYSHSIFDESAAGFALGEAGEWTPPYVSYEVPEGGGLPQFSKETEKLFARFSNAVNEDDLKAELGRYAARLGLRCSDMKSLDDDFYEFRRSFRTHGDFRGYEIRRFVGRVDEDDLPNIADHEMRKGFAFLPIDDRFHELKSRHCEWHARPERLFMGKPIASNLRTVLEDEGRRETLCSHAVEVSADLLSTSAKGFILAGDLAGYGRFCSFLSERSGGLNTAGTAGAQEFRDLAIRLFTQLFHSTDTRHVHTAGDGFICALANSQASTPLEQLAQALNSYLKMTNDLDEINEKAAALAEQQSFDSPPRLGSRLAIHYGPYRFGKISRLASLLPTLDGASVIEAARMEAGLRNWVYDKNQADRHWLAISGEAAEVMSAHGLEAISSFGPFQKQADVELSEKEFASSVEILQVFAP